MKGFEKDEFYKNEIAKLSKTAEVTVGMIGDQMYLQMAHNSKVTQEETRELAYRHLLEPYRALLKELIDLALSKED